ncbi:hypothetical protein ANCCAN_27084 [Ancylostoma caninum]|uniref:Uncharacterized protein n=1 Tax=Ancylostoma caninum TaxID=29170 RepID=A0A368F4Y1_ANCCA|nr:hypothetical protein ANCCAN_27084 [Ancylostoma caninum]
MIALTKAANAYFGGMVVILLLQWWNLDEASAALDRFCAYLTSQALFWKAKQALTSGLLELVGSWNLQNFDCTKLVEALLTMASEMLEQQRKSVAIQSLAVSLLHSFLFLIFFCSFSCVLVLIFAAFFTCGIFMLYFSPFLNFAPISSPLS